jgi:hypothetical protein
VGDVGGPSGGGDVKTTRTTLPSGKELVIEQRRVEPPKDDRVLEERLMKADVSDLMDFLVMQNGINFSRQGDDLGCSSYIALEPHFDFFERIIDARQDDILRYIDAGGVSSKDPAGGDAVERTQRLIRPKTG